MSDFTQYPRYFYTVEDAEDFGRQLGCAFVVRKVPGKPITGPGPGGDTHWQRIAEYAVFTPSSR